MELSLEYKSWLHLYLHFSSPDLTTLQLLLLIKSIMANSLDEELERYCNLIDVSLSFGGSGCGSAAQDTQTTPLFTTDVCSAIKNRDAGQQALGRLAEAFPQYGLLGLRQGTYNQDGHTHATPDTKDNLIFANMNAPWSAFICGSQGGGKSHSLSCLLENCLLPDPRLGVLPNPLAGLVFHYDEFTSITTTQLCEAAYLCSSGIPVRVLVSPSNYHNMARLYSNLPGLPPDVPRPRVMPLYLQETQLNKENIKTLMAVNDTSSSTPLYVAVLFQILRSMSDERPGKAGIDYADFRRRLDAARFTRDQSGPLNLRLQLLESFLDPRITGGKPTTVIPSCDIWDFEPGTLTIVDLSDPFVNENDACALFSISLTLFMESRGQAGRVVALDEAHKVWRLGISSVA